MSSSSHPSASSTEDIDSRIPGAFPAGPGTPVSAQQTLSETLYARRAEYTRLRNVRVKVGTWNIAALKGVERDIAGWLVGGHGVAEAVAGLDINDDKPVSDNLRDSSKQQRNPVTADFSGERTTTAEAASGQDEIGLYVLGLQELVDISSPSEALRPYTDPAPANRVKAALEKGLPAGYRLIAEQQLFGLLLLIYAAPSIVPHIHSASTSSVGTGLMGYMGNKGAVSARLILGETTRLVFLNCHLAAGADKAALERRNWDAAKIASQTRFEPLADAVSASQSSGEKLGDEDFAFWFGDLNYRLEGMPGEDVRHLLTIHTKALDDEPAKRSKELETDDPATKQVLDNASTTSTETEDLSLPSSPDVDPDPASLLTTLSSLLPHDELKQQQKAERAFHDGWNEGPIEFLPTYKYDIGKVGIFDSSDKKRCPSWCDRILYRTRTGKSRYDAKIREREEARKKDEEMKARGIGDSDDDDVLFDYNPDTDGADDDYDDYADAQAEQGLAKEDSEDGIVLESYEAHQRVLSSDHKPLVAEFSLNFDAVIPDLKTQIHQEIVREIDRTENEGRPSITVVVDRTTHSNTSKEQTDFDGVDFRDVRYASIGRRTITIANTGRVPATFRFADHPAEPNHAEGPFPPWLSAHFDRESNPGASDKAEPQYTIDPAEVMNVELIVKVDSFDLVRNLNEGITRLDDILVLRVENGRDHFLPVRGHWLQSAFARSIDQLIRIPEGGVGKLQGQSLSGEEEVKWSAPRELFRLTEVLEDLTEKALADWDMTKQDEDKAPWEHNAGWPFARSHPSSTPLDSTSASFVNVCEALDCDESFESAFSADVRYIQRLEILADVLLVFLRSLQDGIVTAGMWEQLERGMMAQEKSKQQKAVEEERMWALEVLSSAPNHNVSFILLTSMLSRIANEVAKASKPDQDQSSRSSVDLPASPQVPVRRRTLSKMPEVARRQVINRNYAAAFAGPMFRVPPGILKEKERRAQEERMIRVLELFLNEASNGGST